MPWSEVSLVHIKKQGVWFYLYSYNKNVYASYECACINRFIWLEPTLPMADAMMEKNSTKHTVYLTACRYVSLWWITFDLSCSNFFLLVLTSIKQRFISTYIVHQNIFFASMCGAFPAKEKILLLQFRMKWEVVLYIKLFSIHFIF